MTEPLDTYLELQAIARVLHNILLDYPSEDSIDLFAESQLGETWPELTNSAANRQGKLLLNRYLKQWKPELINELKLDYGQLFFGPGEPAAMPWGSVYLGEEQLLNDKSTVALMDFYKQNGISFELEYHQPLDHIGLLYGVIDRLLGQLAEEPNNKQVVDILVILLQQHMLPWSGRCLALAKAHAKTDFYKAITLLAEDFEEILSSKLNLVPMAMRLFR